MAFVGTPEMSNVVSLGPEPPPGEACQKTVDMLRAWLEMAEAGELIGVGLAGVRPGNATIVTNWGGSASSCLMLAATIALSTRVQGCWLQSTAGGEVPGGAA